MSAEPTLATVLVDRVAARASGILTAVRGRLRRVFCLERGQIVFAVSNVIEEQFGEALVREAVITAEQLREGSTAAATEGRKLAQVIVDREWAAEFELQRVLERQIDLLLASTLDWPGGSFEFSPGRANLEGEVEVRVPPVAPILRHARRLPIRLEELRMRIGPPDGRLRVVDARARLLDGAVLGPLEQYLLAHGDGSRSVPDLLLESPEKEEPTLRALYGLCLLGVVVCRREAAAPVDGKGPALDREECLAILGKSEGGDSYTVLGLARTASSEAVRAAYYALARRYHPDRFRSGRLQDLLPRFEAFFTQVTEAYNTLSNPAVRAEYDASFAAAVPDPEVARQSETSYLARQNFARARALLDKRRYADAATFLENAARLDTTQAVYQLELGLVLTRNPRRRADAERHLIRAAELEPTSVPAYLALGQMYQRAGRLAHAARLFREALRWDPEHAEASSLLAGVGGAEGKEPVDFLSPIFGD